MKSKKGFTLAEVLITLSIIGVVAALTIPALTQNTNRSRAVTSVKKAASVLNQALTMSIAQDGIAPNDATNANELKNIFANNLSVLNNDNTNFSVTTADGMIYSFFRGGTCTTPTNNIPTATSCLVEVDINGTSGSSTVGTKTAPADLYYFIIRESDIVPANIATGTPFTIPAGSTLRGKSKSLADDVAQDIFINK